MSMLKTGPKDNSRKKGIAAAHKDALKVEAATRQEAYSKLTPAEKLAKLEGFTATKQRAKLKKEAENKIAITAKRAEKKVK